MKGTYLILACLLFSLSTQAQGYYNQENFGNRSLLLSGNVTGSVDDLGLTYYNPARIALVENPVFSINAKAYQISSLSLKNVFGRNEKLKDSKFEGVPSLLAGTFKIGKSDDHKFAYAFLTRIKTNLDITVRNEVESGGVIDEIEDLDRISNQLKLKTKESDEWFGGTWGTKLRDNFSVGVSAFASVYSFKGEYDLRLAAKNTSDAVGLYNNEFNFSQTSYGLFLKLGAAWKLSNFDLGFNIDVPYLEVIKSGKFSYQKYIAGLENGNEYVYSNLKSLDSKRKEPLGVSVGAGFPFGKSTLHVKVDWHGKLSEYDRLVIPVIDAGNGEEQQFAFKEELKSVINFGLGAEVYLSEKFNVYGSFASDFTPVITSASILDLANSGEESNSDVIADFWHFGLGVEFKMPRVQITAGTTYSFASDNFDRPIDFPGSGVDIPVNDDPSKINVSRWRFIVGLEFPIFGTEVEFK